jgi:hypothetical protein
MSDVAKKIGIRPTFGASPFALGHGEQFERNLLADEAERLFRELRRTPLLSDEQTGFLDLRIKSNGGSDKNLRDLDQAVEMSTEFLKSAGAARGDQVLDLPAVVAALTVRIPKGVMLPEALLIIDVVTVSAVTVDGEVRARLAVGEIKTYPDRGGETNRGQLAQARAQLGLYLHALEVVTAGVPDLERPVLDENGFLVMTRPGSDFPTVRTGENLRYQADRAARGFEQLENMALNLPGGTSDPVTAILTADTHYCEACLQFCDLAERCHAQALQDQNPVVLGDAMAQLLGRVNLRRVVELMGGDSPLDAQEQELVDRLRAAEEPGWE